MKEAGYDAWDMENPEFEYDENWRAGCISSSIGTKEYEELRTRNSFLESKCDSLEEKLGSLQARVSELLNVLRYSETVSEYLFRQIK